MNGITWTAKQMNAAHGCLRPTSLEGHHHFYPQARTCQSYREELIISEAHDWFEVSIKITKLSCQLLAVNSGEGPAQ